MLLSSSNTLTITTDWLDTLPCGIAVGQPIRTPDGQIVDIQFLHGNPEFRRQTGLSLDQVTNTSIQALDPALIAKPDAWINVCETGQPEQVESYHTGLNRWFAWSLHYQNGQVIGTMTDVTDRHRTDRDLPANLLRLMIDNARVGFTLFRPVRDASGAVEDFEYIFTNPVNATNTNRTIDELTGGRLLRFFPAIRHTDYFTNLLHAEATGEPIRFVLPYQQDGISGWYDILFVKIGDYVLFTDLDVTSLKQAELDRQQQAELLRSVLDASMTGTVWYRAIRDIGSDGQPGPVVDFEMALANPSIARMMQTDIDSLIGARVSQLSPDFLSSPAFARYALMVETGESWQAQQQWQDRLYHVSSVKYGDGIVISTLDITDLQESRRQLEQINHDLRQSNESLQQFAYVASHDLQEPLRKIQSFGDLLLTRYADDLPPSAQDMLHRMQLSANRMSVLIRDLLAFSRLTTQQEPARPVELGPLVQDVLADLDQVITTTKATIEYDDLPTVFGDRAQLGRLLQNLLTNALKFTPVDVQTGHAIPPTVRISSRQWPIGDLPDSIRTLLPATNPVAAYSEITVSDDGIGFEPQYRERIFQVFQRLHGRSQYEGTGIGLAICKRIVDNHQGAITAESQPNQGATFRVFLPVS